MNTVSCFIAGHVSGPCHSCRAKLHGMHVVARIDTPAGCDVFKALLCAKCCPKHGEGCALVRAAVAGEAPQAPAAAVIELKPCPFCGAAADPPYQHKAAGKARAFWEITCSVFCVRMMRGTQSEVVANWNKRVGGWPWRPEKNQP